MPLPEVIHGKGYNLAYTYTCIRSAKNKYLYQIYSVHSGIIGYHVFMTAKNQYPEGLHLYHNIDEAEQKYRQL